MGKEIPFYELDMSKLEGKYLSLMLNEIVQWREDSQLPGGGLFRAFLDAHFKKAGASGQELAIAMVEQECLKRYLRLVGIERVLRTYDGNDKGICKHCLTNLDNHEYGPITPGYNAYVCKVRT